MAFPTISKAPAVMAIAGVLFMAACSSESLEDVTPEATTAVKVMDNDFSPRVIEVLEGATVVWSFEDEGKSHDVTGDGWGSEVMTSGSFEQSFATAGVYDYRCTLHGGMTGRVAVLPD